MNKVILTGRCATIPESKATSTGKDMCTFKLAVNKWGKDEAMFVPVKTFGKTAEVPVTSLDAVCGEALAEGTRLDYIQYDVEGAEAEALLGSREIIQRDAPALLVSAYHRSADLFRLPLLVHELNPAYKLYLRRMAGVPAWDINLYAVAD